MRMPGPFGKSALKSILASGCAMVALAIGPSTGFANPKGGQVVSGNVQITAPSATEMVVKQGSDKAIINWQQFSIGAGEHTRFEQPSTSSVSLNRVVGGDPSAILGRLSANGKVMLVNPNGIMFGKDAKVDVNGLLATTHDISNEDFFADRYRFTKPGKPGASVVNDGTITAAEGGLVALVAPGVVNNGVIAARLGRVALAGGGAFALDLYGDELVRFVVPDSAAGSVTTADGQALSSYVSNTGTIIADGGIIALTADTVRSLVSNSVNTSGVIQAQTVSQKGGSIVLDAGPSGSTTVAGRIDATGAASGSKGGSIHATGKTVSIKQNASLDASGKAGGGEVLVGGNFRGGSGDTTGLSASIPIPARKPIRNAETTVVEAGAAIRSDATERGDGGTAVVWADGSTDFRGHVSATGGTQSGNGGLVEVSGKKGLQFNGTVELSSHTGVSGTLLLDPENIEIVSSGGNGVNTLNSSSLEELLKNHHVYILAEKSITVNSEIYSSSDKLFGLVAGNSTVDSFGYPYYGATTRSPNDTRGGDIVINAPITAGSVSIYTDLLGSVTQSKGAVITGKYGVNILSSQITLHDKTISRDILMGTNVYVAEVKTASYQTSPIYYNTTMSFWQMSPNTNESITHDGAIYFYNSDGSGLGAGFELYKGAFLNVTDGAGLRIHFAENSGQGIHIDGSGTTLTSDFTNVSTYYRNNVAYPVPTAANTSLSTTSSLNTFLSQYENTTTGKVMTGPGTTTLDKDNLSAVEDQGQSSLKSAITQVAGEIEIRAESAVAITVSNIRNNFTKAVSDVSKSMEGLLEAETTAEVVKNGLRAIYQTTLGALKTVLSSSGVIEGAFGPELQKAGEILSQYSGAVFSELDAETQKVILNAFDKLDSAMQSNQELAALVEVSDFIEVGNVFTALRLHGKNTGWDVERLPNGDVGAREIGGVKLNPSLPTPEAGYEYFPPVLAGKTDNQRNSHQWAYTEEIKLANRIAESGETVIKYGDKIGAHGSDIISVDLKTNTVTLWDNKARSSAVKISDSPTYRNDGSLSNALKEAESAIRTSGLPDSTKEILIEKIKAKTFNTRTVGSGNVKNSIMIDYTNGISVIGGPNAGGI